jgi:hypothetical protein
MNYKCATPCKISGVCLKESDCCSGYFCHPAGYCAKNPTCTYEYGSCTNTSQCCSGLECNNGQCSKPCKRTGPCSTNAECCVGFFCNQNMQCALQPTILCANSYPGCTGTCTNGWCYDQGMGGCACGAYTDSSCMSLCTSGYSSGRKVHSPLDCSASETYVQGCCCLGGAGPQPSPNWYCCHSDVVGYTCSQSACPLGSLQISGPYTTQLDCQNNCSQPRQYYCCRSPIGYNMCWDTACPSGYTQLNSYFTTQEACSAYCGTSQGQCSVDTPQCGNECTIYHQSQLSICSSGSCPVGYTQLTSNASCANNPPCDRCCCQTVTVSYDAHICQLTAQQRGNFTHSQLAPEGFYWGYQECFNLAQTHCHDYHNGGGAPNGGLIRNCCYWYCSDERLPVP